MACFGGCGVAQEGCPGARLEGVLAADDGAGLAVRQADGSATGVIWPAGYEVRDAPARQLVDPAGDVAARAGDVVALGGGMNQDETAFVVCSRFDVRAAD